MLIQIRKMKAKILWILMILLLCIPPVFAVPVPLGVDGTVRESHGAPIQNQMMFSVNNTVTGQYIEGFTGRLGAGKYSVALRGNVGDVIIITAWEEGRLVYRNLTLEGVMHGVDLVFSAESASQSGSSSQSEGGEFEEYFVSQVQVNDEILDYVQIKEEAPRATKRSGMMNDVLDFIKDVRKIVDAEDPEENHDSKEGDSDSNDLQEILPAISGNVIGGIAQEKISPYAVIVLSVILGLILVGILMRKNE